MSDEKTIAKRISWLIAVTLLNTLLTLGVLALWFFAPNKNHDLSPTNGVHGATAYPPHETRPPPPWNRFPRPPLGQGATGPMYSGTMPETWPPARLDPRYASKPGNIKMAPSTLALAERLHLRAEFLAQTFADESGEVPQNVTKRLEHAFDSATSLVQSRKLDESQSQSVVAILTSYAFSVLREEKAAAPGPPDPSRIESLRNENLTDIRTMCGEDTAKAVEAEIDRW